MYKIANLTIKKMKKISKQSRLAVLEACAIKNQTNIKLDIITLILKESPESDNLIV
jgi:hypothetical protein